MTLKDKYYREREALFRSDLARLKEKKGKRSDRHCHRVIARKNKVSYILVRKIIEGTYKLKTTNTKVA